MLFTYIHHISISLKQFNSFHSSKISVKDRSRTPDLPEDVKIIAPNSPISPLLSSRISLVPQTHPIALTRSASPLSTVNSLQTTVPSLCTNANTAASTSPATVQVSVLYLHHEDPVKDKHLKSSSKHTSKQQQHHSQQLQQQTTAVTPAHSPQQQLQQQQLQQLQLQQQQQQITPLPIPSHQLETARLTKVRRFLGALVQFGMDAGAEVGDRVKSLVFSLAVIILYDFLATARYLIIFHSPHFIEWRFIRGRFSECHPGCHEFPAETECPAVPAGSYTSSAA